MQLPDEFVRNITHVLGDAGRRWIDDLPSLLEACERDYGVKIGPPFELSYNYVAPVTRADGSEAVLKLSPHGRDFRYEIAATRQFDGRGMARLLECNEERGIALLERLRPGTMLVALDDDARSTEIAADIMLELRRDAPTDVDLPTTHDWFGAFEKHRAEYGGAAPLPGDLLEDAERVWNDLLQWQGQPVVLHGDLHHYNVLRAERAPWLAIDPHGVVGEPAFEVGAYFGNPLNIFDMPQPAWIIERRTYILAERLGFERARVIAWGFAYQMLSAVWSAENGGTGFGRAVEVARILRALM
jgi:streptomycin 6-kinase